MPPRFGWPMRCLLFLLLFDMTCRGFSVLLPITEWREELGMERLPRRLPTRAEIHELSHDTVIDQVRQSLESVGEFARPWPNAPVRERILEADPWQRAGKFAICWLNTRLEFLENLAGIDQEWPMFSPNVSRRRWLGRARLVFADGSEQIVRQVADPPDLTCYSHWNQEKVLDYELHVKDDDDTGTFGWCNLLAHRYPHNERGSPLVRIRVFLVRYDFPPPSVDMRQFLRDQTGSPADQVSPEYYEFDAQSRRGTMLPK